MKEVNKDFVKVCDLKLNASVLSQKSKKQELVAIANRLEIIENMLLGTITGKGNFFLAPECNHICSGYF